MSFKMSSENPKSRKVPVRRSSCAGNELSPAPVSPTHTPLCHPSLLPLIPKMANCSISPVLTSKQANDQKEQFSHSVKSCVQLWGLSADRDNEAERRPIWVWSRVKGLTTLCVSDAAFELIQEDNLRKVILSKHCMKITFLLKGPFIAYIVFWQSLTKFLILFTSSVLIRFLSDFYSLSDPKRSYQSQESRWNSFTVYLSQISNENWTYLCILHFWTGTYRQLWWSISVSWQFGSDKRLQIKIPVWFPIMTK